MSVRWPARGLEKHAPKAYEVTTHESMEKALKVVHMDAVMVATIVVSRAERSTPSWVHRFS